jgi:hypothetical protein
VSGTAGITERVTRVGRDDHEKVRLKAGLIPQHCREGLMHRCREPAADQRDQPAHRRDHRQGAVYEEDAEKPRGNREQQPEEDG